MKIAFVADWFADNFQRGAELNDSALLEYLDDLKIEKILCKDLKEIDKNTVYIFGNFMNLNDDIKSKLKKNSYIIYEHDHKYCMTRNPFSYLKMTTEGPILVQNNSGLVPTDNKINVDFYNNAYRVICLTDWHQNQLRLNLPEAKLDNIHGSIWRMEDLDMLDEIRETTRKVDKCAVFNDEDIVVLNDGSKYKQGENIKNKKGNMIYCIKNNIPYRLVPRINDRKKFLKVLSSHNQFAFFPDIPETCSRILTEARMLGLKVHTNEYTGAYHEDWFKLKGQELTDHFRKVILPNAINLFKDYIDECYSSCNTK